MTYAANNKINSRNRGVICPYCCGSNQSVIDSRSVENGWKRRRRMCACGQRFSTIEAPLPEEAEGRSKLAMGINLITYAMTLIQDYEESYYAGRKKYRNKKPPKAEANEG